MVLTVIFFDWSSGLGGCSSGYIPSYPTNQSRRSTCAYCKIFEEYKNLLWCILVNPLLLNYKTYLLHDITIGLFLLSCTLLVNFLSEYPSMHENMIVLKKVVMCNNFTRSVGGIHGGGYIPPPSHA